MAREPELQELASAVADGQQVDWDGLMHDPESADSTVIQNLSRISRLMEAHRHLIREHLPFETWGKLRLLEKIGEGGFGEVYRAWDESLGREVALKLFRQKQDGDSVRGTMSSQQAEDLMMEARRLARVRHENVVHVYGAEEHRHRAGFWMELVTGETLATLMHGQGAMDPEEAAHIGAKLCGGLAAIHKSGLLHRDIKAQNVMREADGRIVLTDMGAGVDLRFTASGLPRSIAGTPLYMAPELIGGGSGDHTADIYSLGVLLYHLVTGRFPYENQTFAALKEDHEHDRRVALTERRADLPPAFVDAVERATAHDPRNRFQSAAELEAVLRPLAKDPGWAPQRTISRPRPIFVALFAIAILSAGSWLGKELLVQDPPPTTSTSQGTSRRLTFSGRANVPVWSPDGRMIAYSAEGGRIEITSPEGGDARRLEIAGDRRGVTWNWSPDSREIIWHAQNPETGAWDVLAVDALTGEYRTLVESAVFGAMSPDGSLLAFATSSGEGGQRIDILDLESGDRRTLVRAEEPGTAVYKPLFAPGGQKLAYVRWAGWGHEIWEIDLDGSNRRQIPTSPLRPGGQYSFTHDGKFILIGAELYGVGSVWKIALDGSSQIPLTEGGPVQDMVSLGPDGESFCYARTSHTSRLAFLDTSTGELTYPTRMDLAIRQPMISSGGKDLYFQALVNGVWEIWKTPIDGRGAARSVIAQERVSCFAPVPGSEGILHLRGDTPNTAVFGEIKWKQVLWSTSEDGGRSRRWPGVGEQIKRLAPGGERSGRILYSQTLDTGEKYFVADPEGGEREIDRDDDIHEVLAFDWGRHSTEVVELQTAWTEDGPRTTLDAIDLDTLARQTLITADMLPFEAEGNALRSCRAIATAWDGSQVAMLLYDGGAELNRVVAYEFASGTTRLLAEIEGELAGQHLAWSPNGAGLAITLSKINWDIYIWEPQRSADMAAAP